MSNLGTAVLAPDWHDPQRVPTPAELARQPRPKDGPWSPLRHITLASLTDRNGRLREDVATVPYHLVPGRPHPLFAVVRFAGRRLYRCWACCHWHPSPSHGRGYCPGPWAP